MNINMNNLKQILMIAPIIIISALIIAPDQSIVFFNGILGKLVAVLIIILYGTYDWIYGVFVALLAIIFYQSGVYESMTLLGGDPEFEPEDVPIFPTKYPPPAEDDAEVAAHCQTNGVLMYKNVTIEHPEYSQYIFDQDIKFTDKPCNICSPHCRGKITRNDKNKKGEPL